MSKSKKAAIGWGFWVLANIFSLLAIWISSATIEGKLGMTGTQLLVNALVTWLWADTR